MKSSDSSGSVYKAVILAAGLGTRMRKAAEGVELSGKVDAVASTGVKALIPIDAGGSARPFLDYVLSNLLEAGYTDVCLVIGPTHDAIRDYYTNQSPPAKLRIDFAIQPEPRGTADALRAAKSFAASDPVLMINSDNFYPVESLRALREVDGHGVALFTREAMIARSNIEPDRIEKFAAVEVDAGGNMQRIHEKPSPQVLSQLGEPIRLSMNCWRFGPGIFDACEKIKPSPRGEYEITDAAQYCIDVRNEPIRALSFEDAVLDLSSRSDIGQVAKRLMGVRVGY